MSGWGVINRAVATMCDSVDDRRDPIHLFASPPYSFQQIDAAKFNVGITMGEQADLKKKKWANGNFVTLCNQMDLLIVPGPWQKGIFQNNHIKPPIEIVPLGHDHKTWASTARTGPNRHVFLLDRGRDNKGSVPIVQSYFDEITQFDCRTPKPDGSKAKTTIIQKGRYTTTEIRSAYNSADVFFKWGREGWCYPILEAMSAGCLVVTNCVHLPYLKDKENCLMFRNVDQLRASLKRASTDPCTTIKRAGQKTAESLTWGKARANILAAIKKHFKG